MRRLILNVDDFEPQRHARTRILQSAGFEVIEAATGSQALALASERHPALVLLDVHLPDADGREICRQIKGTPETADVLVLHISAIFRDAASRVAALSNGADGYLVEAVAPDELVAQVNALLRLAAAESRARSSQLAAEEGEARYRRLFEHMTEGFFLAQLICDEAGRPVDYRYLDVNPAFERFTGIARAAAVGHTLREVLPNLDETWVDTYARVVASGEPASIDAFSMRLGRYYSGVVFPAAPGQFACLFRDTTESHHAEERLRTSEERLRLAQEAGGVGIFDWNLSTGEVAWTPELENIFGIPTPADPTKRQGAWLRALHPDERDAVTNAMTEWLQSGRSELAGDYRIVLPDGRERWLASRSRVFRDADGRPQRVVGTNIDITERTELQQRLEAQRGQLEAVYQAMADGVTVFDVDGRIVFVNDVVARHAGCAGVEEMKGLLQNGLPFELEELDGTRLPNEQWPVSRVLRGETVRDCELRARRTDTGQEWIFSYSGRPILGGQGTQTLALVVSRDVTARKRAEAALRESEEAARRRAEELEALMELVPAAIWVGNDPQCRVITGNRAANRLYEASPGDNVSAGPAGGGAQNIARRFFRDGVELPPERLPMQEAAATGREVRDAEVDVLLPSGRRITIFGSASPLFDEGGGVRGALAAFVDITERKRMEAAMQQARDVAEMQRAEIATLYDSAPIGLCTFDRAGRYLRVNRRLAEMNGVAPELHLGRTIREVVPSIADQAELLLEHVCRTGEPLMGVEIIGETGAEAGARRAWSENWFPVKGPAGDVLAVNVGVEEITRSKQIEEELRQANRLKDDFLATLSHELRTPLTAILGWSQLLLQSGDVTPQMLRQGLATIARNAETQRTMVNDVLDVSRIISGKMRLQLQELDLLAVVADAVESMKPALAAKRLHLDLSALAAPATVTGDPDRLRQVIWNLLSNAVKFTPDEGRITLSVVRGDHTLDLQVTDNGIGIRPEFLPYVFDRFSQADRTASRRHAGLGLGLAIVRHLVELHGGEVFVASDGEGKGSTFTVSLPIRAVRQTPPGAPEEGHATQRSATLEGPALSATALHGVRVLVLDDLEDARALVAAVLQAAGAHTVVVGSGEEALEALAATPADVVLADIGMPGMDGFEFLRRLRATGKAVPVIALTAYGGAADRNHVLAAGFAQHLTKPVLPRELLAGLAKVLERQPSSPR